MEKNKGYEWKIKKILKDKYYKGDINKLFIEMYYMKCIIWNVLYRNV